MTKLCITRERAVAIAWLVHMVTNKNLFIVDSSLDCQTQGLGIASVSSVTVANLALVYKEKDLNVYREESSRIPNKSMTTGC